LGREEGQNREKEEMTPKKVGRREKRE